MGAQSPEQPLQAGDGGAQAPLGAGQGRGRCDPARVRQAPFRPAGGSFVPGVEQMDVGIITHRALRCPGGAGGLGAWPQAPFRIRQSTLGPLGTHVLPSPPAWAVTPPEDRGPAPGQGQPLQPASLPGRLGEEAGGGDQDPVEMVWSGVAALRRGLIPAAPVSEPWCTCEPPPPGPRQAPAHGPGRRALRETPWVGTRPRVHAPLLP